MTSIDYDGSAFVINGVSSTAVAKTLRDSGLGTDRVAEIIGGWFVGATGAVDPAPFHFTTAVQETDPACAPTYARQFTHVDWIDGESRVQAGMTPEELGVNARFHAIENEFDAITAQFTRLGSCGAELRAELFGVVRELEAKITALQNEIQGLHKETTQTQGPQLLGTVQVAGKEQLITKLGNDFKFLDVQSSVIKGAGGPVIDPGHVFRPDTLSAADVLGVVQGLHQTLTDPGLAQVFTPGTQVSVGDLRREASEVVLPTGQTLGSVIATLPADTTFSSPDDAVAQISEHVVGELPAAIAAQVKSNVLTGDAATKTGTAVLNSGVTNIALSTPEINALNAAGINTVAKLSSASSDDIAGALQTAGLDTSTASRILALGVLGRAVRGISQ